MYPFERFTERAKRVLTLAQEEATKLHHNYIGTEHLLLGLLRENQGSQLAAVAPPPRAAPLLASPRPRGEDVNPSSGRKRS